MRDDTVDGAYTLICESSISKCWIMRDALSYAAIFPKTRNLLPYMALVLSLIPTISPVLYSYTIITVVMSLEKAPRMPHIVFLQSHRPHPYLVAHPRGISDMFCNVTN